MLNLSRLETQIQKLEEERGEADPEAAAVLDEVARRAEASREWNTPEFAAAVQKGLLAADGGAPAELTDEEKHAFSIAWDRRSDLIVQVARERGLNWQRLHDEEYRRMEQMRKRGETR